MNNPFVNCQGGGEAEWHCHVMWDGPASSRLEFDLKVPWATAETVREAEEQALKEAIALAQAFIAEQTVAQHKDLDSV